MTSLHSKRRWLILSFVTGLSMIAVYMRYVWTTHAHIRHRSIGTTLTKKFQQRYKTDKHVYNITWYNPPIYLPFVDVLYCDFDSCPYSNCKMNFGPSNVNISDAVLFDGRFVKPRDLFRRRPGQVWIFAAHGTPTSYHDTGMHWARHGWISSFNWTMTYDKTNTDIYLPYGEVRKQPGDVTDHRDYKAVYARKNKTSLIVHSHCRTLSKRKEFVQRLEQFVDLDSLGACGKPMNCGMRYQHDNCFDMVNDYKFFLAFENAICDGYLTEKLFRNYNYDAIMVVRGGRDNDVKNILPAGTYISTDDFKSVKDLAAYLEKVSESETLYTKLLKRKRQFYSVSRKVVYQRAMCDLCERMNKQDQYRKQIANIVDWAFGRNPCQNPTDI